MKLILVLFLTLSLPASAQDLASEFEPVLFPVYSGLRPVSGVGGATFTTRLTMTSTVLFNIYPGIGGLVDEEVGGIVPILPIRGFDKQSKGRIAWIERAAGEQVHFGYTLISNNASAIAQEQRTALPVVRERELRRGRIDLLHIPARPITSPSGGPGGVVGERFRHMLRIYDPTRSGAAVATVRIDMPDVGGGGQPLATLTVPLDRVDGDDESYPYYAELPLQLPCVTFWTAECGNYTARLIITVEPDIPFWAFVSTTDNLTQQVSIYAPQ